MTVDPDGLMLVVFLAAFIGFGIGWVGGVAEGRARAALAGAPSVQDATPMKGQQQ